MLKLGRAQGVAIAAAMHYDLPVAEYAPKKVKQAITGNGNADKEMIWKMLERVFTIKKQPKYYDATDALAVALCHHQQSRGLSIPKKTVVKGKKSAKKSNSWTNFITKNPERVQKNK
jgi:crossover junction endodeoxyribonuclease RuvC